MGIAGVLRSGAVRTTVLMRENECTVMDAQMFCVVWAS